jgi:hypothetical protein
MNDLAQFQPAFNNGVKHKWEPRKIERKQFLLGPRLDSLVPAGVAWTPLGQPGARWGSLAAPGSTWCLLG